MEKETFKVKTPVGGAEIELKSWLTGREKRAIDAVLFEGAKFEEGKFSLDGTRLNNQKDKQLETVIVSIDGKSEDLINTVLDMRLEDYNFVLEEVEKIAQDKESEEAKKKIEDEYYQLINQGKANVSDRLGITLMCKRMGWDYYTFINQPTWFIDILRIIESIDYQYEKANSKK